MLNAKSLTESKKQNKGIAKIQSLGQSISLTNQSRPKRITRVKTKKAKKLISKAVEKYEAKVFLSSVL
jgi:hypothetical protein